MRVIIVLIPFISTFTYCVEYNKIINFGQVYGRTKDIGNRIKSGIKKTIIDATFERINRNLLFGNKIHLNSLLTVE